MRARQIVASNTDPLTELRQQLRDRIVANEAKRRFRNAQYLAAMAPIHEEREQRPAIYSLSDYRIEPRNTAA